MDMAQDGMSKNVSSVLEEKDAANEDLIASRKTAEETNPTTDKMVVSGEPREHRSQKKTTLTSKVKATIKKIGKILRKAKRRKKRNTLYPIVASTLKFHKDDDMDPAADAVSGCRS